MDLQSLILISHNLSIQATLLDMQDAIMLGESMDDALDDAASSLALSMNVNPAFTEYSYDELMEAITNILINQYQSI